VLYVIVCDFFSHYCKDLFSLLAHFSFLLQGLGSVINIFVLHQNRDYGRGRKNCVHETMIPEWMDVVVWGNEHECVPSMVESLAGGSTQPAQGGVG
jgi:hypothetical protein